MFKSFFIRRGEDVISIAEAREQICQEKKGETIYAAWDQLEASEIENDSREGNHLYFIYVIFLALQDEVTNEHFH